MRHYKKILLALFGVFVVIQFIQPARNINEQAMPAAMANHIAVPENVQEILNKSCYDCHSDNTRYPWYATIQPAGWLLAKHIRDGKEELNFDEFGNYPKRRQLNKLKSVASQVNDGEMPLPSYTWIHKDAKLTVADKRLITDWVTNTTDSIQAGN